MTGSEDALRTVTARFNATFNQKDPRAAAVSLPMDST